MLEIIVLIFIVRRMGEICKEKGYKPTPYKIMTVLLFIAIEFIGIFIGTMIEDLLMLNDLIIYLFAIIGATIGVTISFAVINSIGEKEELVL